MPTDDELTGLHNKKGLLLVGEQALRLCRRNHFPALALSIRVNGLAAINEQSGTEAGDAVVKAVADALRDAFRLADVVGRVGDDEFGALLVDYAADPKVALAHIDTAIKERSAVGDLAAEVSVSIGAAFFDPKWPASLDELIGQAAVARTD